MEIKRISTPIGKTLADHLNNLEGKVGKVGWFENSQYEDGTKVASVAVENEFGNPHKHIPARPFMRPTIINKQNEWKKIAFDASKKVIQGSFTIDNVMDLIGLKASADIKQTISKLLTPALSPVTIAARLAKRKNQTKIGNLTKPLIDTGIMLNTLTNSVESE